MKSWLRASCFVILSSFVIGHSSLATAAGDRAFPRGAVPSPRHKLLEAPQHKPTAAPLAQIAYVPKQLDMWGNDRYGDCVTAEEAFCKACYQPEIFIPTSEVEQWARRHGYLNGADLASVLTTMQKDGFQDSSGSQLYNDGNYSSVNYADEAVLQSAIDLGPVKIGIDANALPSGAGNQQGWYATGGGNFPNTDHCVSICGHGPAEFLYSQLNVTMPPSLAGTSGYLVFTWGTIGFVDHAWLMGTTAEAWVRNPTTVGVPPLPSPGPGPTPAPSPSPSPTPSPTRLTFAELIQLVIALAKPDLTPAQSAAVAELFSDEASPRVSLLKTLVYRRALREGAIPAGTSIDAVNWQGLIQFVQALMPLIEQMIVLFGGDEPHAAILAPATLCSAETAIGTEKLPDRKTDKYRIECTARGCYRVPVPESKAKAPAPPKPRKQPAHPAPRRFRLFR